jgi:hypothetical protein
MTKATKPPEKEPTSKMVNFRTEPGVKEALEKAAKADSRTVSSLLQKITTDWLKERKWLK